MNCCECGVEFGPTGKELEEVKNTVGEGAVPMCHDCLEMKTPRVVAIFMPKKPVIEVPGKEDEVQLPRGYLVSNWGPRE
jgi:hypothetical protein